VSKPPLHAVVLAGGAGERFWPASRKAHPKPLLQVVGGRSLLDATLLRAHRFASNDRVWVVCGVEHATELKRASGLPASRVLVEPQRRNTAMAAAWVSQRIAAEDPDAVMAVLPADHHIPDTRAFARDIGRAARAAHDARVMVTLGVTPTRPDTGYGYIELGAKAPSKFRGLHEVRRFVEKPNLARARRYLRGGRHLWNAGVFVWSAQTLLEEIEHCEPKLHAALAPLRKAPKGRNRKAVEAAYRAAPSLPIDVAVMERSRRVWTLPVDFAWSDVGTWASLADELGVGSPRRTSSARKSAASEGTNRVIAGEVLLEDAKSNLVWGGKRLVALLGVEDLAVVDTEDVIFVTKLGAGSDVRRLVSAVRKRGRDDLT
jgi:mannose-1-phosphate guanylyltransferase/mannose-6-phosphate isomerase